MDEHADFCPHCGAPLKTESITSTTVININNRAGTTAESRQKIFAVATVVSAVIIFILSLQKYISIPMANTVLSWLPSWAAGIGSGLFNYLSKLNILHAGSSATTMWGLLHLLFTLSGIWAFVGIFILLFYLFSVTLLAIFVIRIVKRMLKQKTVSVTVPASGVGAGVFVSMTIFCALFGVMIYIVNHVVSNKLYGLDAITGSLFHLDWKFSIMFALSFLTALLARIFGLWTRIFGLPKKPTINPSETE